MKTPARLPGITVEASERDWVGDRPDLPGYEPKPGDQDPSITAHLEARAGWALSVDTYPELDELKAGAEQKTPLP